MSDVEMENPAKMAEAKAFHEKMERAKKAKADVGKNKVSYILNGKKVIKVTVKPNGNKYREYVGNNSDPALAKLVNQK